MNILEKLKTLATAENALTWRKEKDQYLFCSNLLEAADIKSNPSRVEVLEMLLEETLEKRDRMLGYL
jgi:uncharacterized protein YerC